MASVAVGLADGARPGVRHHPADQERDDVEALPGREIIAHDHRSLRVEVGDAHGRGSKA